MRPIALMAVVLLIAAGCSAPSASEPTASEVAAARDATVAELTGPWRPTPLSLDPAVFAAADRVCRQDPGFLGGVTLVIIDARGGGRLPAFYANGESYASCLDLTITGTGELAGHIAHTGTEPFPAMGAGQVRVDRLETDDSRPAPDHWSSMSGRAGPGVARVAVDLPGVGRVTATLRDGWFMAWWHGGIPDGASVTAYDALGVQTARVTF